MTIAQIDEALINVLYLSTREIPFYNKNGVNIQGLIGEYASGVILNKIKFKIIENLKEILPLLTFKQLTIQQKELGEYEIKINLTNQYNEELDFNFDINKTENNIR